MSTRTGEVREIKVGKYVVIDGEPCKVVSYTTAKTGKHGHAKANVVGIGIFDGVKRTLVAPVDAKVEFPIIDKRVAQVLAIMGDTVQLMDMETYETFETTVPPKEELEGELREGAEVEYIVAMGRRKLTRVRG
ncbi:MAG: translation initiation factor IF-5A [Euryarchaeota archaeon]|nr:translation initiation factor IF-5A [Euryarchaeota archaeon]